MQVFKKMTITAMVLGALFLTVSCEQPTSDDGSSSTPTTVTSLSQIQGTWVGSYTETNAETDSTMTVTLKLVVSGSTGTITMVTDMSAMIDAIIENSESEMTETDLWEMMKESDVPGVIFSEGSPYTMTITETFTDADIDSTSTVTVNGNKLTMTNTDEDGITTTLTLTKQ